MHAQLHLSHPESGGTRICLSLKRRRYFHFTKHMSKPIHIIIVEDNPEYRNVLKMAFEFEEGIELVGIFGSAEHALRALEPNSAQDQTPDIILLDLNLPEMPGIEAIKWFRDYLPKTPIIVLTQSEAENDVLSSIQNGAQGYLLKSATVTQIKDSIHAVVNGGALLDSKITQFLIDQIQQAPVKPASKSILSSREMEVPHSLPRAW